MFIYMHKFYTIKEIHAVNVVRALTLYSVHSRIQIGFAW